ncbi:hypothetical protein V502_05761 [Pseudogymnoascus sp. VKM F-4520 (FW-2644)]|nr:hypothetical protein V502_05761 [Pseudogymnoascus sp. VKM F-4520 (FW-2644)]
MARRNAARGSAAPRSGAAVTRRQRSSRISEVPEVYQDMISEALSNEHDSIDRPPKRRRTRQTLESHHEDVNEEQETRPEDIEEEQESAEEVFEDVLPPAAQTVYNSDSGSDSDDATWEDVGLYSDPFQPGLGGADEYERDADQHLDLTLNKVVEAPQRTPRKKGRTFTKEECAAHLMTHKMHLLCLSRYLERRNEWCNDAEVQGILKPLLREKDRQWFKTNPEWTQFRRTESIKKGLEIAGNIWLTNFKITSRGMRRAYWDEDGRISDFVLPPDADRVLDKSDFKLAAKKMEGSRDTGAQLYCALLRGAGLDVRLVCSLQLLPINASSSKTRPPPQGVSTVRPVTPTTPTSDSEAMNIASPSSPFASRASGAPFSARRRLGHPNAADYHIPDTAPPRRPPPPKPKQRRESPYPVFWVEVLDEAHQKWMPIDPLVTGTINKPAVFEPPASDAENTMTYVFAFEEDGAVRDVTRRYTKWYSAKVRKTRVESTDGGQKWLRRTLKFYSRGWKTDLDQIEDIELQTIEGREPMPTSIADFKGHPRYVLERDLRRNEVLVDPHEIGKVAAGRDASSAGGKGKKLESVFRRGDVKTVRSADGWYRLGREVKVGEQPMKSRAARRIANDDEEAGDVALYTEYQTELYEAPPVVNGRVPKNVYGNLDVYVESMVPKGGVHIPYPDAARAARLLGISYSDAVTGFEFRGRQGTAIIKGVVTASEYQEAVEAVIQGFKDDEWHAKEERRTIAALRMWKRFMVGLRIKERVDAYEVEGEEKEKEKEDEYIQDDDDEGMQSEEYDMDEAGGFFPEDDGGGFVPE